VNTEWFGVIYKNYKEKAILTCLKRGLSQEDAEDLVQHAVYSFLSKEDIKQQGAISYFTTFVELGSRSFNAKKYSQTMLYGDLSHEYTPEIALMRKQDLELFEKHINSLRKRYKDVIMARVDGQTIKEMTAAGVDASNEVSARAGRSLRAKSKLNFNLPQVDGELTYREGVKDE
jgi:DNA-directed RNA polymerase specialized sigma24 family protein